MRKLRESPTARKIRLERYAQVRERKKERMKDPEWVKQFNLERKRRRLLREKTGKKRPYRRWA